MEAETEAAGVLGNSHSPGRTQDPFASHLFASRLCAADEAQAVIQDDSYLVAVVAGAALAKC